jgi:bifunctional DNA-binding transcriptional regulator/antitoxin component of YhaV-PrlF toxin-antitoxin module
MSAFVDVGNSMKEKTISIAKVFQLGKPDSLVVVIPKEIRETLHINKGHKYLVKIDQEGRIIYEPVQTSKEGSWNQRK